MALVLTGSIHSSSCLLDFSCIDLYLYLSLREIAAVFGRISYFRTWLEGEMKEATVCKNGFDADAALPRNLNPRNWGRQKRPAVHTRLNLGNKKRNKNKNKKGKKNKKE